MRVNKYVDTYSEVQQWTNGGVRAKLRHIALNALSAKDSIISADGLLQKPRVQFIYLHHMFLDEVANFEQLLERLNKRHTFISHTEAVQRILSCTVDKPYISFSMDDGMKSNLRAADILDRYGIKACFFVNPGIVGETNFEKIKLHCNQTLNFPVVEFMNWNDISNLQSRGHEIGAHTMWHTNMANMDRQEIYDDLAQTMDVIKQKCGLTPHFAFPCGTLAHFSRLALNAVFDTGYKSCITAERGCNVNPDSKIVAKHLCLRRDHLISHWPLSHQMYFIINSARNASEANNHYPDSWQ